MDAGRCIPFRNGDPWVTEIVKYLRLRKMSVTDSAKKRLAQRMPHMDLAFEIHNAKECSLRDLLEAYLLTGQSTAAIAEKTKISPETINAYAAAFFDVADRLDQARFILQEAIFSERDEKRPGVCLKLLAYLDGVSALDELTQRAGIGSSSKWVSLMQEETKLLLLQKVSAAIRKYDVHDQRAAADLLTIYARREGGGKQADQPPDRLREHIQAMMTAFPFNVRGRDNEKVPSELRKFQTAPVELTCDELMQVSMGMELENEAELLDLKFPPRPTAAEQIANQEPSATPPPTPPLQTPPSQRRHCQATAANAARPSRPRRSRHLPRHCLPNRSPR